MAQYGDAIRCGTTAQYWTGTRHRGPHSLAYQWTDRIVAELGVVYEIPITELDTDLSFSVGPSSVPFFGELEPQGLIGFGGVSYYF